MFDPFGSFGIAIFPFPVSTSQLALSPLFGPAECARRVSVIMKVKTIFTLQLPARNQMGNDHMGRFIYPRDPIKTYVLTK